MLKFDQARAEDLDRIVEIERAGFNEAEAGSPAKYKERIQKFTGSFLVARNLEEEIVSFITGPVVNSKYDYIEDWMYEKETESLAGPGGNQMVLTIAVHPDYRGQGIGSQLLDRFAETAKEMKRGRIALTCLEDRVPFYEKNGYVNHGQAESEHAGEIWYNMIKEIED
ncbi:GNAT family N-acetyltransferase [Lactobacillus delbrueckii]|uniref:GNAT family N-acetyltransferase n=1 Tax=Lactobacillus delbrueckii TaxID=1584 RepID=UPI003A8C5BE2